MSFSLPLGFFLVLYILYLCVVAGVFEGSVVEGASASKMSFELDSLDIRCSTIFGSSFLM